MILVRDVFQLKFGASGKAKKAWLKGAGILKKYRSGTPRLLIDLVGPYYTMVLEGTYKSIADYEQARQPMLKSKVWQAWYRRFVPLVDRGYREIFTIVD